MSEIFWHVRLSKKTDKSLGKLPKPIERFGVAATGY
jgi:hypothetical protein